MDQILNKVGSYWIGKKANKELNSVGDDFTSLSSSIGGSTKWLVNKIKGIETELNVTAKVHYIQHSRVVEGEYYGLGATFCLIPNIHNCLAEIEILPLEIVGKMQKPLPDLLKEYDIPVGIFPRDATHYEFDEKTGKLTVFVPQICDVGYKDSSVLRFNNTVTAYLEKGKLADIEGMKTKVVIWVKVTCISTEKTKMYVTAGMKKSRSRDAYEVLRDGVEIEKF